MLSLFIDMFQVPKQELLLVKSSGHLFRYRVVTKVRPTRSLFGERKIRVPSTSGVTLDKFQTTEVMVIKNNFHSDVYHVIKIDN